MSKIRGFRQTQRSSPSDISKFDRFLIEPNFPDSTVYVYPPVPLSYSNQP